MRRRGVGVWGTALGLVGLLSACASAEQGTAVAVGPTVESSTGSSESSWNLAPLTVRGLAQRFGDEVMIGSSLFTTSDADFYDVYGGSDGGVTGEVTLSHEGEVIASSEDVAYLIAPLPSGPAEFTVEANATRDVPWSSLGSYQHRTPRRCQSSWSHELPLPWRRPREPPRGIARNLTRDLLTASTFTY
ncbi:hypothetical protein [Actinoalloteichus sp. AHMU CJ021]|uniref:hypothetical protein n=1 Tax=Actinoalloteichus sp. AHMU CJ021 TaxID=2072503 RepID=UPI0026936529